MSDTAENLITASSPETSVLEQAEAMTGNNAAPLDIQRMYLLRENDTENLDITYFAIPAGSFLEPKVFEGVGLSETDGQMYGHTSVGFITTDSYAALRSELNPNYEPAYHAVVLQGGDVTSVHIDRAEVVAKSDMIDSLPGYTAEQAAIRMIVWVLIVVSAAILGVFYYILTLQKERQFGVIKVIGMGMGKLSGIVSSQVCIVACLGACAGNLLTFGMAAALPQTMPFYLPVIDAMLVTAAFIVISFASSMLSIRRIARIDPLISIGGAEE